MHTNIASFIIVASVLYISSTYGDISVVLKLYALSYVLIIMPISTVSIYAKYSFSIFDNLRQVIPYLIGSLIAGFISNYSLGVLAPAMGNIPKLILSMSLYCLIYVGWLVWLDKGRPGPRFYHDYLPKILK
mgnify:CR=1 FL=1